jgi:glutamate-1-semialdehyde 2,1-aminomutase
MMSQYNKSNQHLESALNYIPLGAQTFSKSQMAFPKDAAPLFLSHGKGCMVSDVDGNEYIDFVNGLLAISLGYCDPDVDQSVMQQMQSGVSFSLSHPIETSVAKKICELIPCAEQVRFAKNGSDATSAAIRLARAFTNREHVAVCGYHGWQDWYIGSTSRNLGVPKAVQSLTHAFQYNNLESLRAILEANKIAAVIMEPMNVAYPEAGFLQGVKELCEQFGAILIFDETITGFRFDIGGAQSLFGVTPDLATFGKGIANGYPISVICGRADIMALMNDIFFSGTFAGETLSLAAALATIEKMQRDDVINHVTTLGDTLSKGLQHLIETHNTQSWMSVSGHPSWSFFNIAPQGNYSALQLRSLFIQEMAKRGILINSSHNLSFSHKAHHIDALLTAYDEVLPILVNAVEQQCLDKYFTGTPLENVFKVR